MDGWRVWIKYDKRKRLDIQYSEYREKTAAMIAETNADWKGEESDEERNAEELTEEETQRKISHLCI